LRKSLLGARGLAGLAAGLTLAVGGCGTGSDDSGADDDRAAHEPRRLDDSGMCPQPLGLSGRYSAAEIDAAKRGRFEVFHVPVKLVPPVDWASDPLEAHRYRQNLYKLRFLGPLLQAYHERGDTAALRRAADLALDFARSNRLGAPATSGEAWTDKVVGDRIPYLAYSARAAGCEGILERGQAAALLDSLEQHAGYLTEPANYVPDNHGLFADTGLLLLSRYLPFVPSARRWARLARHRFLETLRGRVADGVWLEHSCAYQFLAIRAVERFARLRGHDPQLGRLLRSMKDAAGWLVEPDREICQFGDSNLEPVPAWGLRRADEVSGMRTFRHAGFAVVRTGEGGGADGGYLAVTAGFHNLTHKHADELSFELYDRGHRVVTDTGLYHKDPGAAREFVVSPPAHSVLTVDGRDWAIGDSRADYGSAIVATGRGAGWYAVQGRNPLVADQGVRHRRLFLYRPGRALVILDRVRAGEPHRYDRYLQLGPEIRLGDRDADSLEIEAPGFRGSILDQGADDRRMARGRRSPLAGWTSPDFRIFKPRWTVDLRSRDADALETIVVSLDGSTGPVLRSRWDGDEARVALAGRREQATALEVIRRGARLSISSSQAGGRR
jgi:Heparinase II/III-like protein